MPDWSILATHVELELALEKDVLRAVEEDEVTLARRMLRDGKWFSKVCLFDADRNMVRIYLLSGLLADPRVNGDKPDAWSVTRYTSPIFPLIRHGKLGQRVEFNGRPLGAIAAVSEYKRDGGGNLLLATHRVTTGTCQVDGNGAVLGAPGAPAVVVPPIVVRPPATGRMRELIQLSDAPQVSAMHLGYNESIVIEGPPGSGKTSIALHRIPVLIDNQWEHNGRLNRQDPANVSAETCRVLIQNPEMVSYLQTLTHDLQLGTIPTMTLEDFFRDDVYKKSTLNGIGTRRDPSISSSALRRLRSQRATVDSWVAASRGSLLDVNLTARFRLSLPSAVVKFLEGECRLLPEQALSESDLATLLAALEEKVSEVPAQNFEKFAQRSKKTIVDARPPRVADVPLPTLAEYPALRRWALTAQDADFPRLLEGAGLKSDGEVRGLYLGIWSLLSASAAMIGKDDAFAAGLRDVCEWIGKRDQTLLAGLATLADSFGVSAHAGFVHAVRVQYDESHASRSAFGEIQSLISNLEIEPLAVPVAPELCALLRSLCSRCEFRDESLRSVTSAILKGKPKETAIYVREYRDGMQPFGSPTKVVGPAMDGLPDDWVTWQIPDGTLDVSKLLFETLDSCRANSKAFPARHRLTFEKLLQSDQLARRLIALASSLVAESRLTQRWIDQLPTSCNPHAQPGRRWPSYSRANREARDTEWSNVTHAAVGETVIKALSPANILKHISKNPGKYFDRVHDAVIREWLGEYAGDSYNPDDFALFAATAMTTMLERPDQTEAHIPYVAHVVIDEGQDAFPSQLQVIEAVMGPAGTCTVVGDLNQRVVDFAPFSRWSELLPSPRRAEFSVNYRQSFPLSEFTRACLTAIADDAPNWQGDQTRDGPPVRVVDASGQLHVIADEVLHWRQVDRQAGLAVICAGLSAEEQKEVVEAVRRTIMDGTPLRELSVGRRDAYVPNGIIVADVAFTRGMEFTHVVLVVKAPPDADAIENWPATRRNQLYIGASRAISGLSIALYDDGEWLNDVTEHLPAEQRPMKV